MKDKRIEEQFKGYFDGVEIPELPNNIVADAKKSVKRRESRLPRFAKIASIAASFVLVFAVAAVLIARADFSAVQPESGAPASSTYSTEALAKSQKYENAYNISADDENYKSLKFLQTLAYKSNADVTEMQAYSFKDSGKIAYVKAEVTIISGARYDATIYVEYAEQTYEELKEYASFKTGTYRGLSYRLDTIISEEYEPVNKLLVEKDGIKYYFYVQSSDENSYIKCLELLLQN